MHLFVCHTYYHLYAALVLSYLESSDRTQSLITVSLTRNIYKPEFISRLQSISWAGILDLSNQSLVQRISEYNAVQKVLLNLFLARVYPRLNPAVSSIPLDRCQKIFLFNDFHYLSRYVMKKATCQILLVEDGNNNYTPLQSPFLGPTLKKLAGLHPPYGRHPRLKTVLVERPADLPKDIAHKGQKLGLRDKAQKLPRTVRERITALFLDFDPGSISPDSTLVLTQPLFDFGRISFERHIQVYGTIISRLLEKGCPVYLKPHPSDTVDYAAHFNQVSVLPQTFPVEILNTLPHIRFRCALGLNTTAVYNITFADKRVSLLDYHESIKEDFSEKLKKIEQGLQEISAE